MPVSETAATHVMLQGGYSLEGDRDTQEDRFQIREFRTGDGMDALLALVADGIGGATTGEMASHLAKEVVPEYVIRRGPTSSEIPAVLVDAFHEANRRIYQHAVQNPAREGMGTTCTAIVVVGRRMYVAHVGDSRAYLVRGNTIYQLTIDHTWADAALRAGRSPEEIRNHPNRGVILRYLGIELDMEIDTRYRVARVSAEGPYADSASRPVFLESGDSLVLCTDGVHDILSDDEILNTARTYAAPKAARQLVERALQKAKSAGIKADNSTAVVIDLPGARKGDQSRSGVLRWVLTALLLPAIAVALWAVFSFLPNRWRSTPTVVPTMSPTVTRAPSITLSPQPTHTSTQGPSGVGTPARSWTATLIPTPTDTPTPTNTPTPTQTLTPTATHTRPPTPRPTKVPTKEPTKVPTKEPTEVPTKEPTEVPTKEPINTPVPRPTKG